MFMRQDVAQKIGQLFRSGIVPTAAQLDAMRDARAARKKLSAARREASASTTGDKVAAADPENYAVVGNTAEVRIAGVLAEEPDFWAWIMGIEQTCYADIRDAFALAAANPSVSKVILSVDSPGGYVDGLFETLAAIEAFGKPINVVASQACSAAYALAAMGGPIQAAGPASSFGSVGVAQTFNVDPNQIDITSTEAPNKRPDVTTEEGRAVVRAELDAFHELFVDAIARGRANATGESFTASRVNQNFGRGGEVLPEAARAAGMIDKLAAKPKRGGGSRAQAEDAEELPAVPEKLAVAAVVVEPPQQTEPKVTGQAIRKSKMNEKELLAQHPELHAAVLAAGVAAERDRVGAHLTMGEASGDMKTAIAAINAGDAMTATLQAKYMAAGMNRADRSARQGDSDAAGSVVAGAAPVEKIEASIETKDHGDDVAAEVNRILGRSPKGAV